MAAFSLTVLVALCLTFLLMCSRDCSPLDQQQYIFLGLDQLVAGVCRLSDGLRGITTSIPVWMVDWCGS